MIRILIAVLATAILGGVPALAADFNHLNHNTYLDELRCDLCHLEGAESVVPEQESCLECHEQTFVDAVVFPGLKTHGPTWALSHRPFAKGESIDCSACHQQNECLECHAAGFADEMGSTGNAMVNVHRSDFQVSHPIAARTDPQRCASCHENSFCVDCHNDFAPADLAISSHRRGFTGATLGGAHALFTELECAGCHRDGLGNLSVITSNSGWSAAHAREARKNLATCQACHPEGDVCLRCHSATTGLGINPHPEGWDSMKNRLKDAGNGRTCRRCHGSGVLRSIPFFWKETAQGST